MLCSTSKMKPFDGGRERTSTASLGGSTEDRFAFWNSYWLLMSVGRAMCC